MTSFQPLAEQLRVQLSKQQLRIIPSTSSGFQVHETATAAQTVQAENPIEEREFEVEVVNQSDRFASFEIELSAPGQPVVAGNHWYDIEPKVCAKKPPGDRTTFRVVINRPPIPAINTTLGLDVHVFSVEYDDLETTHHLDLSIGQGLQPLQVHLVSPFLKAYPGQALKIEVLAMNLQSEPADITLKLLRLKKDWFLPSTDKALEAISTTVIQQTLPGGDTRRLTFSCMPPKQPLTAMGAYEFDVEISDRTGNTCTTHGQIEVLPAGLVNVVCESRRQIIPDASRPGGRSAAIFPMGFENRSNLSQQLHLQATEANHYRCNIKPIAPIDLPPGDTQELTLEVRRKQPWLGWERRLLIDVIPTLTHPDTGTDIDPIHLKPSTQALDIRVRPVIPLWLQLMGGVLGLILMAWWLWLRPIVRHSAPITTVQIMGQESTVLTGSRDQTVYRWDVSSALGWFRHAPMLRDRAPRNTPLATKEQLGRAVRVIRQSPEKKNQVAIGLENGVIELWDFDKQRRVKPVADQTDRVFALAFADDGKSLFSGHGSGSVRRWNTRKANQSVPEENLYLADTAIADLETLDHDDLSIVAIGGQFNQLVLWDWTNDIAYTVNYAWNSKFTVPPVISSYHSLTEIAVSRDGQLLVTADNRGFITVWDGQKFVNCNQGRVTDTLNITSDEAGGVYTVLCPQRSLQLDQWQATENGVAVNTMALSGDGCYLATATDRGKIALWTLDPKTGKHLNPDPISIGSFNDYSPYEIDIAQHDPNHLLIAVDGPGNRARLFQHRLNSQTVCSSNL